MRVVAAMSGGVDSSVAAARLVEAGHDVTGVYFDLKGAERAGVGCGAPTDRDDAATVAARLGIPFEVWELSEAFSERVVDYFLAEYAAGRTPNPCLRCNSTMKFGAVLERALDRGFDALATGHYARVDAAIPALYRAGYLAKDQSYVIAVLRPEQLRHTMFPIGDVATKAEVRAEASRRGLPVAAKPDSTDICFIADGDTAGFLRRHLGEAAGDIVDESGEVVGRHSGTHQFTVGQRRGLHLNRPAADHRPRYVLGIEPDTRTVRVGPAAALEVSRIDAIRANWLIDPAVVDLEVQVRAHGEPVPATIRPDADSLTCELREPIRGVAAGQGLVGYVGDRAVVQATIAAAR